MSAASATRPRRQRKPFDRDQFRDLHEGFGKLDFTPDFNPSVEKLIADKGVCIEARFLAAVKLQAWGNQSPYAVHDDSRLSPYTQADFAQLLGVARQRVSEVTALLQDRYYLRVEDKRLYPVEDPAAAEEAALADFHRFVRNVPDNPSPNLRLFRQGYFATHPEELAEFEKYLTGINRINSKIRSLFRESLSESYRTNELSGTGANSAGFEERRTGQENTDVPDNSPLTYRTDSTPSLDKEETSLKGSGPEEKSVFEGESSSSTYAETQTTTNPPSESNPDQSRIAVAVQEYGVAEDELVRELIERCQQQALDCTTEEIVHYVHEKGRQIRGDHQIRSPIKYLVKAVAQSFASENYRQYRAQRTQLAAQTSLTRESPPGRLNYYEEKGIQDFVRDLEKEFGDGR